MRLLGPVGREHLFALFAGADLFAFPSRHEGFGIPVVEAMAQGTAVVCADIPALREVAGDAARFVRPDDVDGWVDAIRALLTDDAARGRLVAAGTERVGALLLGSLRAARRWPSTGRRSAGEHVDTGVGDEHGVLELRGARAVGRGGGPAVGPDHRLRSLPMVIMGSMVKTMPGSRTVAAARS